jgi:hypothetical protein
MNTTLGEQIRLALDDKARNPCLVGWLDVFHEQNTKEKWRNQNNKTERRNLYYENQLWKCSVLLTASVPALLIAL